jgi:putative ABC transport system ATP-binding protein
MEPILEASNIVKVLGSGAAEVRALKGVSLELMPGELTLLMGPSGSGKTTLLSILGCILTPSEGTLRIGKNMATGLTSEGMADLRRRHVGFVFQSYNLVPTLTAAENVMLALELRGTPLSEAPGIAENALKQVKLAHRAHAYPSKLSGGEKQRVAIARTILKSPPILMLDEATSALDSHTEKEIQDALERVARERTSLVIAHRLSTVVHADNIIVLDHGEIVEQGTHLELLARGGLYASLWARQREADQARERLAQVLDHEPEPESRAAERLEDEALAGN